MNVLTHLALGYLITKLFGFYYPSSAFWVIIFCAIAPDGDAFISSYLTPRIEHRELFHTIILIPIFAFLSSILAVNISNSMEFLSLFLIASFSVSSHLIADIITTEDKGRYMEELSILHTKGIKLFYPVSDREFKILVSGQTYRNANLGIFILSFCVWFVIAFFH